MPHLIPSYFLQYDRLPVLRRWTLGVILCLLSTNVSAQGTQTPFGRNQVQHKKFTWSLHETDNFTIYFYMGGQELGRYMTEHAEKNLREVEKKLEYRVNTPIQVLIHNAYSDQKQSNIGRKLELYNTGGMTEIIGTKVFLHFTGSHADLERQLREGIAKVFLNDMMYGGNIQDAVQNAVLLNLPGWFTKGLISYAGQDWTTAMDDRLRDGLLSGDYERFNRLSGMDAKFAGHSVWHFIAQKYGKSAIPNILYLTRINRSMESGFLFVLGQNLEETLQEWRHYYLQAYHKDTVARHIPHDSLHVGKRPRRRPDYYQLKLNPNGRHIAYVTNILGRYKVRVYDMEKNKKKTILRAGFKSLRLKNDHSLPMLAWAPNKKELAVVYEKKDKIYLRQYNIETGEQKESALDPYFQEVTGMDFAYNSNTLVLSAVARGQSNISLFHIPSHRITRITEDFYNDAEPAFVKLQDREGIIFRSNRPTDTLKKLDVRKMDTLPSLPQYDLFFYEHKQRRNTLIRMTHNKGVVEHNPQQYGASHFSFLADYNGIFNRYVGYFDTTFSHNDTLVYFRDSTVKNPYYTPEVYASIPNDSIDSLQIKPVYKDTAIFYPITNYARNILEQDISLEAEMGLDLVYYNGRYRFYRFTPGQPLSAVAKDQLPVTYYRQQAPYVSAVPKDAIRGSKSQKTPASGTDTSGASVKEEPTPYFQYPKAVIHPDDTLSLESDDQEKAADPDRVSGVDRSLSRTDQADHGEATGLFKSSETHIYRPLFSTDYVVTQFDNTMLFTPYQSFTGSGAVFQQPPFTNDGDLFQQPRFSPLIQVGTADLFENYLFTGGLRVPTDFSGSEFFVSFEHVKQRLNKKLTYYRQVRSDAFSMEPFWPFPLFTRLKMNYLEGSLTWPFNPVSSLRLHGGYRNDRITFLARDTLSLNLPHYEENWFFTRLEYVYDHTVRWHINTREGFRFKVFVEELREINDVHTEPLEILPKKSFTYVFGGDFRHYLKVYRQIIFANRFAFRRSMGPRKIVYYMGGMDNELFANFNHDITVSMDEGYAFQTLATNMRGFQQNIRNGNNYAVINSEIRIPFFRHFHLFTSSAFFQNFQIIGFGDIGTAWVGLSPFDEDNPLNTETVGQPPVTVRVNHLRNPVVQGYGFGMRSTVLGYFLRLDIGWGLEDGLFNAPQYHLSMSLDF